MNEQRPIVPPKKLSIFKTMGQKVIDEKEKALSARVKGLLSTSPTSSDNEDNDKSDEGAEHTHPVAPAT